jgi:ankyrin repeat protein
VCPDHTPLELSARPFLVLPWGLCQAGYTPLHYAAYNGETGAAAVLLAHNRELVHAIDKVTCGPTHAATPTPAGASSPYPA